MPRLKPPPGRAASARAVEVPDEETTDVLAQDQEQETVIEEPSQEEDASVAFQKQIEALKKSEQTARERLEQANREREEALARAKARETEAATLRKQTVESQVEAVSSALAAAQADAEAAIRDIAAAAEAGDGAAQAQAYRKLAKAEANIARLEDGKAELEERAKAPQPEQVEAQGGDRIDQLPISANAKTFLRQNPQYLSNPRLNAKLNAIHYDLLDEGYEAYSDDYLDAVRERMEPRRQAKVEEQEEEVQPQRRSTVSAPVSREAPSSSGTERSGRITLTVAQKEAAKIAGISEVEYAKNLQRLKAEKAAGNYTGQP